MESHIKINQPFATTSRATLGTESSFAATQAAGRVYAYKDTILKKLSSTILVSSRENIESYYKLLKIQMVQLEHGLLKAHSLILM